MFAGRTFLESNPSQYQLDVFARLIGRFTVIFSWKTALADTLVDVSWENDLERRVLSVRRYTTQPKEHLLGNFFTFKLIYLYWQKGLQSGLGNESPRHTKLLKGSETGSYVIRCYKCRHYLLSCLSRIRGVVMPAHGDDSIRYAVNATTLGVRRSMPLVLLQPLCK